MLTLHDLQVQAIIYNEFVDTIYMSSRIVERLSLTLRGLTSNGKRQTAKMTSAFVFFPSNHS